jgi:predicted component of type VI protein secretion system
MQPKGRYRLTIKQGPAPGKVFEIARPVITLGRDVNSDFVINDAEVSRSHARLTLQPDGCLVEDLASTNGTFVNGQRVTLPKMMRSGDMLGLGETVTLDFNFVPDAEATMVAPPDIDLTPIPGARAYPEPSSAALEPVRDTRLYWILGIGCGCLTLLGCFALTAIVLYFAFQPGFFGS